MKPITITRTTKETTVKVSLDTTKQRCVSTTIPFFDHMLDLVLFHSGLPIQIEATGDTNVDDHHTVEDVGIVLGQVLRDYIKTLEGFKRYGGIYLPMDETLSRVVVDVSNRPYLVFDASFEQLKLGSLSTQNIKEFFRAITQEARLTLHMTLFYGDNDHHKAESLFKGFARAIKEALTPTNGDVPSSKGVL